MSSSPLLGMTLNEEEDERARLERDNFDLKMQMAQMERKMANIVDTRGIGESRRYLDDDGDDLSDVGLYRRGGNIDDRRNCNPRMEHANSAASTSIGRSAILEGGSGKQEASSSVSSVSRRQYERLERLLDERTRQLDEKSRAVENRDRVLIQARDAIERLKEEVDHTGEANEALEARATRVEEDLAHALQRLKDAECERNARTTEIHSLRAESGLLLKEVEMKRKECTELEDARKSAVDDRVAALEDAKNAAERHRAEMADANALSASLKDQHSKARAELNNLKRSLAQAESQRDGCREELDLSKRACDDMSRKLAASVKKCEDFEEVKRSFDEKSMALKDAQNSVERLRGVISDVEERNQSLQSLKRQADADLEQSDHRRSEAESRARGYRTELETSKKTNTSLWKELELIKGNFREIEEQMNRSIKERDSILAQAGDAIENLQVELKEAKGNVEELKELKQTADTNLELCNAQQTEAEDQLKKCRSELEETHRANDALSEKLNSVKADFAKLEEMKRAVEERDLMLAESCTAIRELQAELDNARKENASVEERANQAEERLEKCLSERTDVHAQLKSQAEQIESSREELYALFRQLKEAKKKVKERDFVLDQAKIAIEKMRTEKKDLKEEVAVLRRKDGKEVPVATREQDMRFLRKENVHIKKQLESSFRRCKELKKLLNVQITQRQEAENMFKTVCADLDRLRENETAVVAAGQKGAVKAVSSCMIYEEKSALQKELIDLRSKYKEDCGKFPDTKSALENEQKKTKCLATELRDLKDGLLLKEKELSAVNRVLDNVRKERDTLRNEERLLVTTRPNFSVIEADSSHSGPWNASSNWHVSRKEWNVVYVDLNTKAREVDSILARVVSTVNLSNALADQFQRIISKTCIDTNDTCLRGTPNTNGHKMSPTLCSMARDCSELLAKNACLSAELQQTGKDLRSVYHRFTQLASKAIDEKSCRQRKQT